MIQDLLNDLRADLEAGVPARKILKDKRLKLAFGKIKDLSPKDQVIVGRQLNEFRQSLQDQPQALKLDKIDFFDVTAPQGTEPARLVDPEKGSVHPLSQAQSEILDILIRLGFNPQPARQIDSQYYMFSSLNFPPNHPARDDYDTFNLAQTDQEGHPLIAPSHTSTMQNRLLKAWSAAGCPEPLAVLMPGRVFRNDDVDASHDHMFHQIEGVYVSQDVTAANLIATLKELMQAYYQKDLKIKIQPSYFPFTEPSFEFSISCPFCQGDCKVCSEGWLELLGCGMIHPNVLEAGQVDPKKYTGFAWGLGLMRMAMIKYDINDIRQFAGGQLEFLRQF